MSKNSISECVKAARLFDEINRKKFLPIPSDWFTVSDYMEDNKCGLTKANTSLKALLENRKLKKQQWLVMGLDGRTGRKNIYKTK